MNKSNSAMNKTHKDQSSEVSIFDPVSKEQMPQPGDHLGQCRIIESIAAGGMANVYKVWQEQLEVVRAIKILKPGFDEESKSRLETEAKISANLRHHNIVEIFGMSFWNGIPFIEMEYVDGPSLKELLETSGRFPVPFTISVIHGLCSALQFAHNQDLTLYGKVYDSLIHRDIKPANILISSKGVVKLADFGIARPSDVSLHTVGGKVMGTFAYLSPEQLNGEKLDQCSDIYAIGAVLYEMLTGTKTYPQKMLTELVHRKSRGQYIPVSSLSRDVPKSLCSAVEKCLSLDKSKRYQSAADLDNDVISSLKKTSMKYFEDTIKSYISNPVPLPKQAVKARKSQRLTLISVTVLFLLSAVIGVFLVDRYWDDLIPEKKQDTTIVKQETATPVNQPPASVNQSQASVQPSETINKTVQITETASVSKIHDLPKKEPAPAVKNDNENELQKAIDTYKNGDYSSATDRFMALKSDSQYDKDKDIISIYILESMIKSGNSDKAIKMAETQECNDGYYYYLAGEQLYIKKALEKAEDAFKKARSKQSLFNKEAPQKASYYLAKIRDGLYMMKPNIDNKQLSIRAWTTYLDMYCTDEQSKECSEANSRLGALGFKAQE